MVSHFEVYKSSHTKSVLKTAYLNLVLINYHMHARCVTGAHLY